MANLAADIGVAPWLYPFRSHFLELDGLRYHYLDEGRGEPVVMLHGNPTWSFYYRELVKALRDRWRVIVPDHIGCGLSDKPPAGRYPYRLQNRVDDLQRLIDHLQLGGGITLVLHDWGGMIGAAWALRQPERVGRLVVSNTAAFPPPGGKRLPRRLRVIRDGGLLSAFLVRGLNAFALAATRMATRRGLSPPVRRGLLAPYDSWANRVAVLKFVEDIPLSPNDPSWAPVDHAGRHLHRLADRPTLICWGMGDFVFDADYLAEWRRRFPAAEVHAFEDAGHYLLEDAPGPLTALVRRFLERNPL